MITIFVIILGVLMIVAAMAALYFKNLTSAILAAGVVSLLASVLYLLLASPDVAMTEAAIGSGLTTVVFLYAFNRIRKSGEKDG